MTLRNTITPLLWATAAITSSLANPSSLFTPLSREQSGLHFTHPFLENHPQAYLYHSGFAVGSICIGDINGDSIQDVYLVNGPETNRMFIQSTDQQFQQQKTSPSLAGATTWGTGANLVDIDNDGDLDLYQCNYDAPNQLFINNGKGQFTELEGAAGLNVTDASMSANFADIDNDGDLDMFLLCNRYYNPKGRPSSPPFFIKAGVPHIHPEYQKYYKLTKAENGAHTANDYGRADYLFLNQGANAEGQWHFKDVSQESGVHLEGYGLSSVWWDYDSDGDVDLYVANDFEVEDRLFRNEGLSSNGTPRFTNVIGEAFPHTTWSSMGSDSADINNDGLPDLMVVDMSATTHFKSKVNMGEMNGPTRKILETGWPRQAMRNHLFVNRGVTPMQESAFASGLYSSDWSWSVKFGDLDNDGLQDVFITNGMARNFTHSDRNIAIGSKAKARIGHTLWDLHKNAPPMLEHNFVYQNLDGKKFKKRPEWGLSLLGMSYCSAMGDLDNDGDLDLIVSDLGKEVKLYQNQGTAGNSLRIQLSGTASNRMGIGAKVVVTDSSGVQRTRWMNPWTGFQAQNDPTLHFGLGNNTASKVAVYWPSGIYQEMPVTTNCRELSINEQGSGSPPNPPTSKSHFSLTKAPDFTHREKPFDDFKQQPLLPSQHSQVGPCLAAADVDGDGDQDFFVGGGNGQPGALFLNNESTFTLSHQPAFGGLAKYADHTAALWFDADGDKDLDLLVVTGGSEYAPDDIVYHDHLYLNESKGSTVKLVLAPDGAFPRLKDSGSCVSAADYDADGDLDLFIGSRLVPGAYPSLPRNRLLRNDSSKGKVQFTEVTPKPLQTCGMVTGATWVDLDTDGDPDLALSIDWGPIILFENRGGKLYDISAKTDTAALKGWWTSIHACDIDRDGDMDLVCGNAGTNTKYKSPSELKPAMIYYGDMDGSGTPRIVEAKKGKNVHDKERPLPVRGRS